MSFPFTPTPKPPGTYFQTPAPSRSHGPLFASRPLSPPSGNVAGSNLGASTAARPKMPAPEIKAKPESISPRERAARTIDEALLQESRYPDLDSYLSQGYSSDYDIPSSPAWAPFHKVKMYRIPDQIFDQYNRAQVSTSMGLFAELNHAWVTIDNALYLWDYTHPNPQLIGFEEQPNSINMVKLARPRKGVFLPAVTHMLVISTTADVFLMGLACENAGGYKSVTIYQTGMSVPIRGLDINVIASSDSTGRIFFAGSSDNDVYELTYQQEERWFQGRCSKVNHTTKSFTAFAPQFNLRNKPTEFVEQMVVDDSRNLLYTLSSNSSIRVFHLRPDGSVNLTITKTAIDIYSNIGHIITSNETLNPRVKIVSISPIPAPEASRYHLMATTATGYRIYLSATGSYSWSATPNANNAPTSMQAQHVKTPPSDSPSDQAPQAAPVPGAPFHTTGPSKVSIHSLNPTSSAERFPPGYFFCFTQKDNSKQADTLFISTPDSGKLAIPRDPSTPIKPEETGIWLTLGSRAEAIGLYTPYDQGGPTSSGFGNELAVQFDKPAAEIAVLTNTGVHIIRRRRLVDMFASLIRNSDGEDGLEDRVQTFIRIYGRSETIATALAVACGQGMEVSPDSRLSKINDPDVLEFARKVFIEKGGKPTINENAVTDGSVPAIDTVLPSPRHAGIALYTSRLLRSIWKTVIAQQGRTPAGGLSITPGVPTSTLLTIQRDLSALKDFFNTNRTFIEGLSGPDALSKVATKQEEVALQAEHRGLHSLVQLISHTIEGISFILVLFDDRAEDVIALLNEDARNRFLELTFEQLFATSKGHETAKELVKAIVNRNIAKGSNVETVAEALRRRCGTFCSPQDVIVFKGQELLKRATEAGPNSEVGRNLLNESLMLFQQVSESLPMDYLKPSVEQYIQNQFFAGAIQLALSVAADSDKANHALSWIMDGRPAEDPRKEAYDSRQQCYDLIYKVILAVDELSEQDSCDGPYSLIARRRAEAYDVITTSRDEVFLTSLYDWYLARGLSDRLLEIRSPFVATYLERKSTEDIFHADLLWKYYAQSDRFYDAAVVQLQLAKSPFKLTLNRRIEYLGQARANASVQSPDVGRAARQRLQHEVEELLDVSHVQDDLLQRLKDDPRLDNDRRAEVLETMNGGIMEISKMYNEYAAPGNYHDICLQIMYLANHRNASDITTTWQDLIQGVHEETLKNGTPLPYEAVIEKVRSLALRLRMSDVAFPVKTLLPMLERYRLEHQKNDGPPTWVVDLFLELQVEPEVLYTVLESLFYNDEVPFHGANRKFVGNDLAYLISRWFNETSRLGGAAFGSDVIAARVSEMLLLLQQSRLDKDVVQACRDMRVKLEQSFR
ncbi:nuclear pore complex protein Nup155 [Trichophyton equinum CBS 127.97]|uniref:Nuclear pore complex protein Nup155 n=1 Tax=Trichophyton equinum (strain ATCC MYA-4606 / CBS 127.97) TaxID=559882 RepID=F2Q226_TRIEC|nr:nuclear pore complex protein Nup155 [Trichophyton equinum CBS 127.97]